MTNLYAYREEREKRILALKRGFYFIAPFHFTQDNWGPKTSTHLPGSHIPESLPSNDYYRAMVLFVKSGRKENNAFMK